jgi:thiamine-phosphate pyrophosphorylase
MLPPLTPAVARALEVACFYTLGARAAAVEPVHLLHALLEEDEGRAARLAVEAGLDQQAYRAGRPTRATEGATSRPLSASLDEILRLARELSVEWTGESTVSSEPMFLALLRGEANIATYLEKIGLRVSTLEAILSRQKPPVLQLEEPLDLADVTERMDAARILDAGANRVREAIRTVEDYCRFVLEDRLLSNELKGLRHDFNSAIEQWGPQEMTCARDTLRDVGTTISTESERTRSSLHDVARVNLKRLEEALRSLEEFSKITSPPLGEQIEQLRYRAYTLERAVLLVGESQQRLRNALLYVLLSGAECAASLEWTIEEAAGGGADVIQLREKTLPDRELLVRARNVRRWTRKAGVLFIVNDRPDVARLVEADGVHLGQDDMPVKDARRVLGADALIGVSTHDIEQVRQAVLDGASYIGVGPTFPSATKTFEEFPGLDFLRAALAETTLSAFAIGGINPQTIAAVTAAGAHRVAVGHAIAKADDPRSAAAILRRALDGAAKSLGNT